MIRRSFFKSAGAGLGLAALSWQNALGSVKEELKAELEGFVINNPQKEADWLKVKDEFKFADGLHYFNNASLGPSPLPVQNATNNYRALLDGFPSKYMWGGWQDEKEDVRQKVADLLKVSSEEIALIHNTSEGMNLIARSFDLQPGDEVILADHEHASGTIPWQFWQENRGIKLIRPTLPILPESVDELVDCYRKAITPKTKVISMCHIVNTNGMILPVKEVSEMAHQKGIPVAVDGAQGAGMYEIDLNDMGCDFYAASSHKWLFSPKGMGVFYARKDSQDMLKPLMVARGHKNKSIRRLETYNTRNLPELLGLGASVDFINRIGIESIDKRAFELKSYFKESISSNEKLVLKTPASDRLSASIQVVEVQGQKVGDAKERLFEEFGIDSRPMSNFDLNALRLSFPIYITRQDVDYLVEALNTIST